MAVKESSVGVSRQCQFSKDILSSADTLTLSTDADTVSLLATGRPDDLK
jgi:hypothetical protein